MDTQLTDRFKALERIRGSRSSKDDLSQAFAVLSNSKKARSYITKPAEEWEGVGGEIARKFKILGSGLTKGISLEYYDPIGDVSRETNLSTGEKLLELGGDIVGSAPIFAVLSSLTGGGAGAVKAGQTISKLDKLRKALKVGKISSKAVSGISKGLQSTKIIKDATKAKKVANIAFGGAKLGGLYGAVRKQHEGENRVTSSLKDALLFGTLPVAGAKIAPYAKKGMEKVSPYIKKGKEKFNPIVEKFKSLVPEKKYAERIFTETKKINDKDLKSMLKKGEIPDEFFPDKELSDKLKSLRNQIDEVNRVNTIKQYRSIQKTTKEEAKLNAQIKKMAYDGKAYSKKFQDDIIKRRDYKTTEKSFTEAIYRQDSMEKINKLADELESSIKNFTANNNKKFDLIQGKMKKVTPLSAKEMQETVHDLARKADRSIESYYFTRTFQHDEIISKFSDAERVIMGARLQNTPIHKTLLKNKDIREALDNLAKNPKRLAEIDEVAKTLRVTGKSVKKLYEKNKQKLTAQDDSIPHLSKQHLKKAMKRPKGGVKAELRDSNVLKKKTYKTNFDALEAGKMPLTLDAVEQTQYNLNQLVRGMKQNQLAENLNKLSKSTGEKFVVVGEEGIKKGWTKVKNDNSNKLYRTLAGNKEGDLYVNPDVKKVISGIFDDRRLFEHQDMEKFFEKFESVNGITKYMMLTGSFFHGGALTETGAAILSPLDLSKVLGSAVRKAFNPSKMDAYSKMNLQNVRSAILDGVQVGGSKDAMKSMVDGLIEKATIKYGAKSKQVKNILSGVKKYKKWNDGVLWENLHKNFKIIGYQTIKNNMMRTNSYLPQKFKKSAKQVGEEAARFINSTFGQQDMIDRAFSPKVQRAAQGMFLAPDWLLSTMDQAITPTGLGAKHSKILRSVEGLRFWGKASLYLLTLANAMNYTTSKFLHGEGRTMEDNESGHKTHILIGKTKEGKNQYLRMGKQFRELYEFMYEHDGRFSPVTATMTKLGGKTSPNIQLMSKLATGRSPSGFTDWNISGKKGLEKMLGMGKTVLESGVPFSLKSAFSDRTEFHPAQLLAPVSEGMTKYKARQLLKEALKKDNKQEVINIYKSMKENNLDADRLLKNALRYKRK